MSNLGIHESTYSRGGTMKTYLDLPMGTRNPSKFKIT